jgi:hypothetical protein
VFPVILDRFYKFSGGDAMRKVRRGFGLLLSFSFLATIHGVLLTAAHAETRTAADLTPEAVWEAIDAAQDGDTVQLPAEAE